MKAAPRLRSVRWSPRCRRSPMRVAKEDRDGLAALLGDAMKALTAQGIPLITFRSRRPRSIYRVHAPKVFGDDISSRRSTVVEANKTGKQIVGVEPGREALSIFGMTPIMRDGKSVANADVGAAFGKEFVDRAKKRFGIDLAVLFVRRQGVQEAVLDLRRRRGRHRRTSSRACSTASRCAATRRSTAIPPRSISGRSRITPASRSAFSKSSRTRPSMKRRRRVRSAI